MPRGESSKCRYLSWVCPAAAMPSKLRSHTGSLPATATIDGYSHGAGEGGEMLDKFVKAGIHIEGLGDQLRFEGAASFVKS